MDFTDKGERRGVPNLWGTNVSVMWIITLDTTYSDGAIT